MRLFKSYWKVNRLAVILLVVSCQTTGADSTKAKSAKSSSSTSKPVKLALAERTSPSEYFSYYCQNGKPKRSYQHSITVYLPKVDGQLPIDLAAKVDRMILNAARRDVRSLFSPKDSLPIYAVAEPKSGDLEKSLRMTPISPNDLKVVQSASEVIEQSGVPEQAIELPWSFQLTGNSGQMLLGLSSAINFEKQIASEVGPRPSIYDHFTMLVPLGAQRQIFPILFKNLESGYKPTKGMPIETQKLVQAQYEQIERAQAAFINQDGTFNLTAAIYQRYDMWKLYADKFTYVKEAQTEDPHVVKFQVGLALDAVCAYGRPVDQLQTHW